mmetsp:Transcript_2296/g.5452  ORF Transcript_2296/g.5452 Transcript_2296/m.5452 type:complete len:309 (-) Transcript_2296:52-978(-)
MGQVCLVLCMALMCGAALSSSPEKSRETERETRSVSKCCALVGLGAGLGAIGATSLGIPAVLGLVGFESAGVATGSIAAAWHSTIGNVASGSIFSILQSVSMGGVSAGLSVGAAGSSSAAAVLLFCDKINSLGVCGLSVDDATIERGSRFLLDALARLDQREGKQEVGNEERIDIRDSNDDSWSALKHSMQSRVSAAREALRSFAEGQLQRIQEKKTAGGDVAGVGVEGASEDDAWVSWSAWMSSHVQAAKQTLGSLAATAACAAQKMSADAGELASPHLQKAAASVSSVGEKAAASVVAWWDRPEQK